MNTLKQSLEEMLPKTTQTSDLSAAISDSLYALSLGEIALEQHLSIWIARRLGGVDIESDKEYCEGLKLVRELINKLKEKLYV